MADQKFDTEEFLRNAISVLQAKLNTEIGLINTEKGDFSIETIPDSAYFCNLIPQNISFGVFIFYGILEETPEDSIEVGNLKRVTLQFEIGMADKNFETGQETIYRLLRYKRALEQVFSKNFRSFGNGKKPLIETLPPAALILKGNRFEFTGVNVSIRVDA